MSKNILEEIINNRIIEIKYRKKLIPYDVLKKNIIEYESMYENKFYNFKKRVEDNIKNNKISIIAEMKKASPSAGIILKDYKPIDIAKIYKNNNATCLSVLTEEKYFLGSMMYISFIKSEKLDLPILCKDFFIDKYQIYWARSCGADAILIILAGVSDKLANELYEESLKLNMSVIVEVHTVQEAKRALRFKDSLIGINNRNLKTLKTDLNATYDIHDVLINHKGPLISESGIKTKEELLELSNKTSIKTFLIGESLLKNLDNNSIFSVL
jgi:indole-3-glycerol phosphate synthase